MIQQINFTSKYCKAETHVKCSSIWKGLGLVVFCDCPCHKKREVAGSGPSNNRCESNYLIADSEVDDR